MSKRLPPHAGIGSERLEELLGQARARPSVVVSPIESPPIMPTTKPVEEEPATRVTSENTFTAEVSAQPEESAGGLLARRHRQRTKRCPDSSEPDRLSPDHRWIRPLLHTPREGREASAFERRMYDLQIALAQAVLDLRENIKLLDTEPRVDFILPAALGALLLDASAMAPRCWGDGDKIASTRGVQIHADNALTNTRRIGTTTTAGSPYIYRHQYLGPVAEFGVDLTGSDVLTAEIAALTKIFSNRKPRPPFLPLIRFVRANPSAVLETTLCNLAAYYIPSGTKLMLGKPKLINSPAHEGLELT